LSDVWVRRVFKGRWPGKEFSRAGREVLKTGLFFSLNQSESGHWIWRYVWGAGEAGGAELTKG
jgi:hypothetical protein